MVFNIFKRNHKPQIGLDIAPNGITAVLLHKKSKGFSLKKLAYEPFSEEVIQNGLISNSTVFIKTLKKLFDENKFDTKMVNIALPSNIIFLKTIILPDLPLDELMIIAPQEASKHIPIPIEEVNIDFDVLENTRRQEETGRKVDVIMVASAKSMIKNYVDHICDAGLDIASIDITPFAMIRTLANAELIDNSDYMYISVLIGYENTDINIIHKGMPLFSNNVPIGRKNVIDSISHSLEIDNSAIEKLLPEIALIVPGMNVEDLDPQLSKAAAVVRNIYNNISSEIQKTIEFYYSQNSENKEIKKIIVGGSGVCVENIDKYIANRLKIDTMLCDSLNNIDHNIDENFTNGIKIPALVTSVGLALKGLQD
ncbi:MAG: hypothetical protein A2287_10200 [Candidatus Melainabacteria bacterium RIFOXYA12_FULL_32_12]|nr:MAG: hypothetical protein A2255_05145 [Candidatus Melainabacteria bacterium RIFOXYA2_FULL_32_9]OGI25529.1 MAG: hypothetical protein A2287_10200 [Candidatus Melainabacteria bacterium RIFOXYA12_FULL_32_12]